MKRLKIPKLRMKMPSGVLVEGRFDGIHRLVEGAEAGAAQLSADASYDLTPVPESMIAELKLLANQRDVPYQSLLKVFLAEKIKEERTRKAEDRVSSTRRRLGD
jgi:hypothetical protein